MERQRVARTADDPLDPDVLGLQIMIKESHVIVHRFCDVIFPRARILDAAVDDDNISIVRDTMRYSPLCRVGIIDSPETRVGWKKKIWMTMAMANAMMME